jgi:uncharacterized protein
MGAIMSRFYGPEHRALQERFDTARLADDLENRIVYTEIIDEYRAFIEQRDMFWLATVDHSGRPTVSYKGGDPGFVRVLDQYTIAFPSYDGNGMYYSMGNIAGNEQVGLLFTDFENPFRLRVQGTATIDNQDPLLETYKEAQLVVRVRVSEIFRNCPRYVHRHERVETSRFVPRDGVETPVAEWKRIHEIQELLTPEDRARAAKEGPLQTRAEYDAKMAARVFKT